MDTIPILDDTPDFLPNCIWAEGASLMFSGVPDSVKEYAKKLQKQGWRFFAVRQDRGRCYRRFKVITIPSWVFSRAVEEKIWYISHELAHAYDKTHANHGDEFMRQLILICPDDCIHYELGYKPRNAAKHNITPQGVKRLVDLL